MRFVVEASHPRDRLDRLALVLLTEAGVPTSRAAAQRWIEAGRVLVNGRAGLRPSASVPIGAHIEITPEPPEASSAEPDASVTLRVVHEDTSLLVVDKPAGLVVHPARGHATGTLVNGLLARGGFARINADPKDPAGHLRPGIVHRLDKDTSGLLVVAKDASTRETLKAAFAAHAIEREYLALVIGEAKEATYATLHARHPTDRLRFTSQTSSGRRAVTHVRVVERFEGATLVACTLQTGRTHQIRVHLTEQAGTPILADSLYGRAPRDAALAQIARELGRQALHARVLGFTHPSTRAVVRWESELPPDFAAALEKLRATKRAT
jgi:23S rRNA pseudouridine1911/1915/1917 synthase